MREVVSAGRPLPMVIERGGEKISLAVMPELDPKTGVGVAGWSERTQIEVGGLVPGYDAEKKGLRRGDLLLRINGRPIYTVYDIHETLRQSEGRPVEVVYLRDGREHAVVLQPALSEEGPAGPRWMIGVELAPRVTYVSLSLPEALRESLRQNARGATLIYQFLQSIVERRSSARSLEGPIRIAQLSGEAAREGAPAFLNLMATVSLNLAIFNLLPIPILDGGVILLLLIEMMIRRDLSLSFKEAIFKLGFVFLMMVVAFVLYNDITKLLPG
ncbi:MAG: site-2 protease family protein, partial [Bryobacteraceae bacterium]